MQLMLRAAPAASLLLLLGASSPQQLAHQIPKDGKTTRTVVRILDLRSTRIAVGLGAGSDGGVDGPKIRFVDTDRFTATDVHSDVKNGASSSFTRKFTAIEGSLLQGMEAPEGFEDQSSEETLEKRSALEGRTVRFERAGKEWKANWPRGEDGAVELLKGLDADLEFAALLPPKGLGHHESWTIDAAMVRTILLPGGVPVCEPKDASPNVKTRPIWLAIAEHLEGEAKVTLGEPRVVGGQTLAVLAIEGKATAKGVVPDSGTMNMELEFRGEALWDIAERRLHSIATTGETKLSLESKKSTKLGSRTIDVTEKVEFEGKLTTKVE